jgi:hypothetical protein
MSDFFLRFFKEEREPAAAEWERMRLVIDARPEYWEVIVYDPTDCEVMYTAQRMTITSSKFAAIDFVSITRIGAHHDLKAEVIAEMLVWERV